MGESTQAGRWHCADLLAGVAARLGQSDDVVQCRCVSRCCCFSFFTIHLQISCDIELGFINSLLKPLWQPGKIPLAGQKSAATVTCADGTVSPSTPAPETI